MVAAVRGREDFTFVALDLPTSTEYEQKSLDEGVNLSDGHARQPLTVTQAAIIDRVPEAFHRAALEQLR